MNLSHPTPVGKASLNMIKKMPLHGMAGFCLASAACMALAQNTLDNPDWTEEASKPTPAYSTNQLIPITVPPHLSLKIGVDPTTVQTGGDGVVRYVVVMTNASGSVNAAYEGIRCLTNEVKTYARSNNAAGAWVPVANPQWKSVNELPSKHAASISRQGACQARMAPTTSEVVRALKRRDTVTSTGEN